MVVGSNKQRAGASVEQNFWSWPRGGQLLDLLVLQIFDQDRTVLVKHRESVPGDPDSATTLASKRIPDFAVLLDRVEVVGATVEV